MSSLVVLYRESVEQVAELWNASAEALGFTVLSPLEYVRTTDGTFGDWDIFRLDDCNLYVGLYQHSDDLARLLIEGGRPEASLVEKILDLPVKPVEVLWAKNYGWEFADSLIGGPAECETVEFLDSVDSGWNLWEIRTLQALHNDFLSPLEEWQAAARERGYPMRSYGSYQILDVHFTDGVPYPEKSDPMTGLPADDDEVVERQMQHPFGTRILLALTAVEPNPERNYETWLEVLPRVAQTLTDDLSEGDTLARYYTPREFVITKPGLPYSQARAELERLRALLETSLKPIRLKGRLSSASWPEEVPSAEEMTGGSGWDKLMDRAQSLLL